MKKALIKTLKNLAILINASILLIVCSNINILSKGVDAAQDNVVIESSETKENTEANESLHFADAWGGRHNVEIDSTVPHHNYNWEYFSNDKNGISYKDENYTIRKGVDVSGHQGYIDWKKVKADGYDFAIIRLGFRGYGKSGSLQVDKEFRRNAANAQAAGLDVGVYFFSQAINEAEAKEEANLVINSLSEFKLQLPVVYDPELIRDDFARTDDVTGEQFTKNTILFCEMVKQAGYEPMIYSNMVWESFIYNMKELENYEFWYADYESVPQTPYHFSYWQYSEKGTVDGIEGYTDLDIQFIKND